MHGPHQTDKPKVLGERVALEAERPGFLFWLHFACELGPCLHLSSPDSVSLYNEEKLDGVFLRMVLSPLLGIKQQDSGDTRFSPGADKRF
jgi:hypothetical protein